MLACDLSFDYILFACYCVSIPLYMIVLWVLCRVPSSDKTLGTSFFRIVISTGIVDVILATINYGIWKFRLWGWAYGFYAQIDPIPKYFGCIGLLTTFSQCIGITLIAFNRYTALAMPFRHEEIWSAKRVRLCIAAQWLIPTAITLPGAIFGLADYIFFMVPDDGMLHGFNYTGLLPFPVMLWARDKQVQWTNIFFENLVISSWGATSLIVLVVYSRLFCLMRTVMHNAQTNSQQAQSARTLSSEFRLLAYGIIVVVIQSLAAIFHFLVLYSGQNIWYRPTAVIVDLNCYSNPYLLLALSAPLRERFLAFLKIRRGNNRVSLIMPSQAQSRQKGPLTNATPLK